MDIIINKFQKQVRKKLKSHIKKIILFGSRARGDAWEWSDYDFAVIVDIRNKEIEDQISEINGELFYEYSKLIGSIIWDEEEWKDRQRYPIGVNILKDGREI